MILTLQDAGEPLRPENVVLVGHWNSDHPNVYMEMDLSVQRGPPTSYNWGYNSYN